MASNGSGSGALRLALALSCASSSTSSCHVPSTKDSRGPAARSRGAAASAEPTGKSDTSRLPPTSGRTRHLGAPPSLSLNSGHRMSHTPSSLRDLRKMPGALGGRLLGLRRERSTVGVGDKRGDGHRPEQRLSKGSDAAPLGSFDQSGSSGSSKIANSPPGPPAAAAASSEHLGGAPTSRRVHGSRGGNSRFLSSSFSNGTSASSRRLGALLRAASGVAGSATAGLSMAGRASTRTRSERTLGGGGASGGSPAVVDIATNSSSPDRLAALPPSSSSPSLSPAAKAASLSSPAFVPGNDPTHRTLDIPDREDRAHVAPKVLGVGLSNRPRRAKSPERMFRTELTSAAELVACNVQLRESDMGIGIRRVSSRLRRRPESIPPKHPVSGGGRSFSPVKYPGGEGLDGRVASHTHGRIGQPPGLGLKSTDAEVEGTASAGDLRLLSPVTPSS
ncbi:hypothetical protein BU14_0792s0003 [Porphyra umbilicalis]|uniref:Uncharacterized protein n=1 Tax=Porphyra umbilicalis TaxID=2786 RepID=A0A1X6NNX9_PORUM|nr:hypothetical protein BU14_0792s0003 [Porphyra umbilicalis]|eukprot:OSX70314.1 hypothetical protein BU14_0792s0003 [Porphyra umbilicalis]